MRYGRFLSVVFVSSLCWTGVPTVEAAPPAAEEEDTGPPAVVAVLPLAVRGDIAKRERNDVRGQLVNNLDLEHIRVVNDEVVGESVPDGGCSTTDCITTVAQAHEAKYVVRMSVGAEVENEYDVVFDLLDGSTGAVLDSFGEACKICGRADLVRMSREQALDLRSALKRLEKAAREPEPEPITAPVAATAEPEIRYERVEVPKVVKSPLEGAGWGLVGGGAALVAGGGVLLALTTQSAGCLDDPRGGECIPVRYTNVIPGAAVLGGGVLVAGTGVALLLVGRKRAKAQAEAQSASVQPQIGPGSVGLRGRF